MKKNKRQLLVSIIIPTHNRKEMVGRLINSILQNTYRNFEIIIVDDYSSDGTLEYLRSMFKSERVKIIRNKRNLYTAGSRNIGYQKSKGELIFFIDDDNLLATDTISQLVNAFSDDKVGESGPVNYSIDNKKRILWLRTKRNMSTSFTNQSRSLKGLMGPYWETDDIPNAFMVRRNIMERYNIHFDSTYGIMYEESDFAYRIRNAGYKIVVVKNAKIYHEAENDNSINSKKHYMHHFMNDSRRPYTFARNRVLFHKKYSTELQFLTVAFFGVWAFFLYYAYRFLTFQGNYAFAYRLSLIWQYMKGNSTGIRLSLFGV